MAPSWLFLLPPAAQGQRQEALMPPASERGQGHLHVLHLSAAELTYSSDIIATFPASGLLAGNLLWDCVSIAWGLDTA